jgi:hypothetical protein
MDRRVFAEEGPKQGESFPKTGSSGFEQGERTVHAPIAFVSSEYAVSATLPFQVDAPLPEECQNMIGMWPDNKSQLLAELMGHITAETEDKVLSLSPVDQVSIAFCFTVTMPVDKDLWDHYVDSFITRLLRLRGHTESPTNSMTMIAAEGARSIILQFVLGGMSSIMAGLLTSVLKKIVPQIHKDVE